MSDFMIGSCFVVAGIAWVVWTTWDDIKPFDDGDF